LGQVQQPVVDEGRPGVLLRTLSGAAGRQTLEAAVKDKKIYYHRLGTRNPPTA
jgi:hypothetical protein